MRHHTATALALALASALCACSPASNEPKTDAAGMKTPEAPAPAGPIVAQTSPNPGAPASPKVLGLAGLGDLRIGEAVPKGSAWAERGAQTGEACRIFTASTYPGVYAMVIDGKVQRITAGQRSDVKLAEGIGVGASEQEVRKWFAGFREEPHKYEDAPAKYLTAPNAATGGSALRFEIGHDDKVKLIHIGLMPALAYVEGCG